VLIITYTYPLQEKKIAVYESIRCCFNRRQQRKSCG
jgi:hypothetical protein